LNDTPFIYNAKYSSNEESIDIVARADTWRMAHHQIYTILNPVNGEGPSEGEHTPRVNRGGRHNVETSAINNDSSYTITEKEWEIARNAIANNSRVPSGVSTGTLNVYHTILERNWVRLANEQADLDRRRQAADQSSERRRALHGSASRNNQGPGRFQPRIPRLSKADDREITSNLSNSCMTMHTAGMVRAKTVEGATVNLAAY
jgi:hypothetical protein